MTIHRLVSSLTLASALLFAPALAGAQPRPDGGAQVGPHDRGQGHGPGRGFGHRGHKLRQLAQRLGLSEAQQTQIRQILIEQRDRARAMRQSTPDGSPERRAARERMRAETERRIDAVLTPAQRTQARQLRREHDQRRRERCQELLAQPPAR